MQVNAEYLRALERDRARMQRLGERLERLQPLLDAARELSRLRNVTSEHDRLLRLICRALDDYERKDS